MSESATTPPRSASGSSSDSSPLVSVCIPVFNGLTFLPETFASVAQQTARDVEVIISDNGSTDGSREWLREAVPRMPFPTRLLMDAPTGMVPNWNRVADAARGAWIKFVFQDDLLEPHCIERMLASVADHPRAALAFSRRRILSDESTRPTPLETATLAHVRSLHQVTLPAVASGRHYLRQPDLLSATPLNFIGEPTSVLIRRSALQSAGPFDATLRQLVDFEMWLRLCVEGEVVFVDEPLASFRVHRAQMSAQYARNGTDGAQRERHAFFDAIASTRTFRCLHPRARARMRTELRERGRSHLAPSPALDEVFWLLATAAVRSARRALRPILAP